MVTSATSLSAHHTQHWQTGMVTISDGQLAYHRTGGSGPAMVLSHGLTDNGLCWGRVARALEGKYDIIMLDARGHGASSRIVPGQSHDPAVDLAEAIAALGLEAPIVMGHSIGASATAAWANTHLGRATKVILEDPPFLPEIDFAKAQQRREGFRRQMVEFQLQTDEEIAAHGRKTSPLWHEDEFPAWARSKRQVDPEAVPIRLLPWQATIDKIAVPTLLIYGEGDRGGLVTPQLAQEAMRINPRIETVQISGAGHNIRRENFEGFLSVVRDFLND